MYPVNVPAKFEVWDNRVT